MRDSIDVIDGIEVDWSKFKCSNNGVHLEKSKIAYIKLCKTLHYNGDTLIGCYINNKTPILILLKDGVEKYVTVSNYRKQTIRKIKNENGVIYKPTGIEYIDNVLVNWDMFDGNTSTNGHMKRMANSYVDLVKLINKNNHILMSNYKSNKEDVLIDFKCGHKPQWISPNSYKNGHGCKKCAGNCSEQAKEILIDMINDNGHELLSEYESNSKEVLVDFKCKHEPQWVYPSSYKNGNGCPMCSLTSKHRSKYEFEELVRNNGHELLSEYTINKDKVIIDFKCGHKPHEITPANYKNGNGCPMCKRKGEAALYKLLTEMGYEVKTQHKYDDLKDKSYLRYDFYIPKYNLLIELDGEHHREPIKYKSKFTSDNDKHIEELDADIRLYERKLKDKMKDDYANNNNIPLLRIVYNSNKIELDKWKAIIEEEINKLNK